MSPGPELALLVEGFDPERGGAERAVAALAHALIADGVPVAVYAPASRAGPELPAPGRRVAVRVPPAPRPVWALALARSLGRAARRDGARRIVSCGKLWGADGYWPHGGVHAAARAASIESRRGGRKTLSRIGRGLRPAEWAYDMIETRALAACHHSDARAIALSERVRRDMERMHGFAPETVRVVRNGIDASRFAPPDADARGEARRALATRVGARGDSPLALFCAHSFRLKGLETLLRAAGAVPGVHVVVAGDDAPQPFLELAAGMGLANRLTFLGRVADMAPLYRGATFLAHPSRYDPCSLVVLEALASGLPVVASPADGASELVVPGESGFVLGGPEDGDGLAAAMTQLSDPKVRARCAAGAAEFRRPWATVGRELLEALG